MKICLCLILQALYFIIQPVHLSDISEADCFSHSHKRCETESCPRHFLCFLCSLLNIQWKNRKHSVLFMVSVFLQGFLWFWIWLQTTRDHLDPGSPTPAWPTSQRDWRWALALDTQEARSREFSQSERGFSDVSDSTWTHHKICLCLCPQSALVFWLDKGVDGVLLSGVERVASVVPSQWTDIRAIVQNRTDERPNKRSGPEHRQNKLLKCILTKTQKNQQTDYYNPEFKFWSQQTDQFCQFSWTFKTRDEVQTSVATFCYLFIYLFFCLFVCSFVFLLKLSGCNLKGEYLRKAPCWVHSPTPGGSRSPEERWLICDYYLWIFSHPGNETALSSVQRTERGSTVSRVLPSAGFSPALDRWLVSMLTPGDLYTAQNLKTDVSSHSVDNLMIITFFFTFCTFK